MEQILIGLIAGSVLAYFIFLKFQKKDKNGNTQTQSLVLMEKIRSVCKLVTVEGDFSEIYHYENIQKKWLKLLLGKKSALVLIDAKAHIGFDLSKLHMDADVKSKTITLSNFPKPELLTIETDFKYYDKREGWANPFTASDLTEINKEAKQHIVEKIPESGLYREASKQALESIMMMEKLVETINWKLDYTSLLLPESELKKAIASHEA